MGLDKYKEMRDFSATPEPYTGSGTKHGALKFVIQRHQASHLHYDFRLEINGVLVSWAVPKGPSLFPGDRRLAMQTEDHPYDYRTFAGVIPEGHYGAGVVEIWDEGTYTAAPAKSRKEDEAALAEGLRKGTIRFILHGKRLQGQFALVRMHGREKNAWLLVKHGDEYAVDEPWSAEEHLEGLKHPARAEAVREAKKGGKAKKAAGEGKSRPSSESRARPAGEIKARPSGEAEGGRRGEADGEAGEAAEVSRVHPMLATLYDEPFDHPDWLFEIKFDGFRAIAEIDHGEVSLYSRTGKPFEDRYQPIVDALSGLPHQAVLDGEIVVLDEQGVSRFQLMQQYLDRRYDALFYYVFDLLELDGHDLRGLPLVDRKQLLERLVPERSRIRYSEHIVESGKDFYAAAAKGGLEGIVAKRASSPYQDGLRSDAWRKIKTHDRQEAIVCGFTDPRGARNHFGALILGVYDRGRLKHVGNCGSGFDRGSLLDLRRTFEPYIQAGSPFKEAVPAPTRITWMRPELVCEVEHGGWTQDGRMRHPIYQGLRTDKPAREVVREREKHVDEEALETEEPAPEARRTKKPLSLHTSPPAGAEKKEKAKRSAAPSPREERSTIGRSPAVIDASGDVKIGKRHVHLTSLDKVFWPDEGFTKGDVIAYYQEMSELILTYLRGRSQNMRRNPNGIEDEGFFQKDVPATAPDWLETVAIYSESNERNLNYLVCNDAATLAWMNNLGCIEINPWHMRVDALETPDWCVMDLDPGENTFDEVIEVALVARDILDRAKVPVYPKTSGATGMHLYIPLGARYTVDQSTQFARLLAELIHEKLPKLTSIERSPKARRKQIYLDYLQNRTGQTLASVYSLRPRPGATISTPLEWREVKAGLTPAQFTLRTIRKRLEQKGDLFAPVLGDGIDMLESLKRMEG